MTTYDMMRSFADSWGLLGMFLFFIATLLFVFLRPHSKTLADQAKMIPFREDK